METLGVPRRLTFEQIARCIAETGGVGFMFAQTTTGAMKNVAPVQGNGRQDLLQHPGPLTSPADAPNIVMGVFHPGSVGIQVRALQRLGAEHAVVVYSPRRHGRGQPGRRHPGGRAEDGEISEYEIHPEDFGLRMQSNRSIQVETPEQSVAMLRGVLDNQEGAARDIVALNAGVVLYAAGVVPPHDGRHRPRVPGHRQAARQAKAGAGAGADAVAGGGLTGGRHVAGPPRRHLDRPGHLGPVSGGGAGDSKTACSSRS